MGLKKFLSLYKVLWKLLPRPQKMKMALVMMVLIVGVILTSAIPVYFGYMVQKYDQGNILLSTAIGLIGGYAALLLINYFINELRAYLLSLLDNDIFHQLMTSSYLKILSQEFAFHLKNEKGAIWEYLRQGADSGSTILQNFMAGILPFALQTIVAAVVLIYLVGWIGGIGIFMMVGLFCVIAIKGGKKLKSIQSEIITAETQNAAKAINGLNNIETVKLFAAEKAIANTQKTEMDKYHFHVRRYVAVRFLYKTLGFLIMIGGFLWILLAPYLVQSNDNLPVYNSQTLVTVSLYFMQIIVPLQQLHMHYLEVVENILKWENLQKYLYFADEKSETSLSSNTLNNNEKILVKLEKASLSFQNHTVLQDIDLTITQGERTAIIGSSGSGKSSLCNIISGLLKPSTGKIIYHPSLQKEEGLATAVVPQQVPLFNQSLHFNVALGYNNPNMTVKEALKMASLDDLLTKYPNLNDTWLGEGGISLSGGEKQRIGLARALYRQPKLLILDEATSNLDSETEKSILDSLDNLPANLAILFVTHKKTSLSRMNRVIKVHQGLLQKT